jgi:hypothetical protein
MTKIKRNLTNFISSISGCSTLHSQDYKIFLNMKEWEKS